MSRTTRRTKLNQKKRFFKHYWEKYSEKQIKSSDYLPAWKYHSDNYHTKSSKIRKQFLKSLSFNQMKLEFNQKFHQLKKMDLQNEQFDINMEHHYFYNIKWKLH